MADPDMQNMQQTPYVEDETGLKAIIFTPDSQSRFSNINRDIVLSNSKDYDVAFYCATQNIIILISNLTLAPELQKEINEKYPGSTYGPFDNVIDSFISEMAIRANANRSLDMKQAELLHTNISRIRKSLRSVEPKTGSLFNKGGQGNDNEQY